MKLISTVDMVYVPINKNRTGTHQNRLRNPTETIKTQ